MRFLLFIFMLAAASCSKNNELKSYYPHLKWDDSFKGVKIIVDQEFQNKNVSGMKIGFEGALKGHQLISEMIVNVDPDTANKLFKNKMLMIKGLYSIQTTSDEGGRCTADMNIDPALLDKKNQMSLQFDLKATERLVVGVCLEEQNVYRNQTLLIYCKNINTFYDLKYFYPKNQKTLKVPIASCY